MGEGREVEMSCEENITWVHHTGAARNTEPLSWCNIGHRFKVKNNPRFLPPTPSHTPPLVAAAVLTCTCDHEFESLAWLFLHILCTEGGGARGGARFDSTHAMQ